MTYFSKSVVTATGLSTTFAVPFPLISRNHLQVTLGGVAKAFTWLNDGLISISPAPSGALVLKRVTPLGNRLVDFSNLSALSSAMLDLSAVQALYCMQELADQGEDLAATSGAGPAGPAGPPGTAAPAHNSVVDAKVGQVHVYRATSPIVFPPYTTQARFQLWGAGAGGGVLTTRGAVGPGGGGAGAYFEKVISVIPGDTYLIEIGVAGISETDGTSSTVSHMVAGSPVLMLEAPGGMTPVAVGVGGDGGIPDTNIYLLSCSGQQGANGTLCDVGATIDIAQAGDGGSAAFGGSGGRARRIGDTGTDPIGSDGQFPGGGGGGSYSPGASLVAGKGAPGLILVTF